MTHARTAETVPVNPAGTAGLPTYGSLVARYEGALSEAVALSSCPVVDPEAAQGEVMGFERFLRVAGAHLELLGRLHHADSFAWLELGQRLGRLPLWESSTGSWATTAEMLGTAHDLLATHVGPGLAPRTPDGESLEGHPALAVQARQLTERVQEAGAAGTELLDRVAEWQRRDRSHPLTREQFRVLRVAIAVIPLYARAARWDLRGASHESDLLTDLTVAPTPHTALTGETNGHDLVRLLQRYVREQSRGVSPASHTSLRDLAVLAAHVTRDEAPPPSAPASGLARLERAQQADQMADAHRQWSQLAHLLQTRVFSLTKASPTFAMVVQRLQASDDPALHRAVLESLPTLGRHMAETVRIMTRSGSLLTSQREPGQVRSTWRPLQPEAADHLVQMVLDSTTAGAALSRTDAASAAAAAPATRGVVRTAEQSLHRRISS